MMMDTRVAAQRIEPGRHHKPSTEALPCCNGKHFNSATSPAQFAHQDYCLRSTHDAEGTMEWREMWKQVRRDWTGIWLPQHLTNSFEIWPLIRHLPHGGNTKMRTRQSLARHYTQCSLSESSSYWRHRVQHGGRETAAVH